MGRVGRKVEQNGADGPPILRAIENACQHQDRGYRMHGVCQGKQDGHGRQNPHAWQDANEVSDNDSEQAPEHVVPLERYGKAIEQVC